ncbi:GDSL-type esterase/lipase family protein [Nocardia sp. NBC_01503]|uniref:GDSL-type esterase/lipase family protein n=1 Tax=Nocardia sp. NBC_01503 TaxID=2975997 RepID=UPI002E7B2EFC|nr:GDSL-type esterase/lipase family protein [Nocardia sp. NBC_01503]WTL31499.1 GDSL-type esterase/lipase family protein [Nocardia sp. NBC_01503]
MAVAAAATLLIAPPPANAGPDGCDSAHWVSNWSASPSDARPATEIGVTPARPQTYRVIATPHLGGDSVRIHLTNRFGKEPVTFTRVTVARQGIGAAVQPDSVNSALFGGRESITVAPGGDIVSDPVSIAFANFAPLAVSIYMDSAPSTVPGHDDGNATSYYTGAGSGDHASDAVGEAFVNATTRVPFLSQIDVLAAPDTATVVAFGDSITEGFVGADFLGNPRLDGVVDQNVRYPDFLQRRLDAAGRKLVVTNAGIGGDRLTRDAIPVMPRFGPSGLSRLQADVIAQSGVSDVIVLIGINDLGTPIGVGYEEMIDGYTTMIDQFHRAGLAVHLGTILPASNALLHGYISIPPADPVRMRINAWIRSQALADSVIDFDAALRDPGNPGVVDSRYVGADNLHPNPEGYRVMAEAIDIDRFAGSRCQS